MDIRPVIVEQSSYRRQLELADRLAEFLSKVKDFKAIRKFDSLLYLAPPEGAGKHFNRHYQDLALTEFGFFISERYTRIEFSFYRLKNPSAGRRDELSFCIAEKTIPAIIEGLRAHRTNLEKWLAEEDTVNAYECGIEREIERQFEGEMTRTQFDAKRRAVSQMLQKLADVVSKAKV